MNPDRKEHLREYILACIRDNVLTWDDITSLRALNKLLMTLSKDSREVFANLGREGAGGLLRIGAVKLAGIVENLAKSAGKKRGF